MNDKQKWALDSISTSSGMQCNNIIEIKVSGSPYKVWTKTYWEEVMQLQHKIIVGLKGTPMPDTKF